MFGRKKHYQRCLVFISILLVTSFINFSISPSYFALGTSGYAGRNLHPEHGIFGPIINKEVEEKKMVESVILTRFEQEPGMLDKTEKVADDLSSLIRGKRKLVEVFFSRARMIEGLRSLGDRPVKGVFLIPCMVSGTPYFTQMLIYSDGSRKSSVYSAKQFSDYCLELVREGHLSQDAAQGLEKELSPGTLVDSGNIRFLDHMDESVQASMFFLEKTGAAGMAESLKEMVTNRNVIVSREPVPLSGGIVVREDQGPRERAESIIEALFVERGEDYEDLGKSFSDFWDLWEQKTEDSFDIEEYPKVKLSIMRIERETPERTGEGSNEGGIEFRDEAYSSMIDVRGVDIDDCRETIDDIKKAFRKVAEHDMPEALKEQYALYKMRRQLDVLAKREEYEKAAIVRDRISAIERELSITDENREDSKAYHEKLFDNMPGLNPDKITVCELSNCILPTDIATKDGTVRINENFVKLMYQMIFVGMKGHLGLIYYYTDQEQKELGDLYNSIIYAIAIHTIRGHFPKDEAGLVMFNSDESIAQGERGQSHIYVNLLALLYYWIVLVEHHKWPRKRAEFFVKRYPELFRKLTDSQKQTIAADLGMLCRDLLRRDAYPFPAEGVDTGMTRQDVKDIMRDYPDSVSNEGKAKSEEMWADAVVDGLVSGSNAQSIKADGGKIVLALETDWVPGEQEPLIQKLVQEVGKLTDAGTVEVVRGSPDELAAKLNAVIERDNVPLKNVIVLGSMLTIARSEFEAIRATSETDTNKAFMVGVDTQELTGDSYVRLLEMITMAVRMAFDQKPISDHPAIEVITMNPRLVVFIPRAEPMDLDAIKRIYDSQAKILSAA